VENLMCFLWTYCICCQLYYRHCWWFERSEDSHSKYLFYALFKIIR